MKKNPAAKAAFDKWWKKEHPNGFYLAGGAEEAVEFAESAYVEAFESPRRDGIYCCSTRVMVGFRMPTDREYLPIYEGRCKKCGRGWKIVVSGALARMALNQPKEDEGVEEKQEGS